MKNYITTLDPLFDLFFDVEDRKEEVMDTDIIENENSYLMQISVPNVKKEDIKLSLERGYLNVELVSRVNHSKENKYILRERKDTHYSRSYYLGEDIKMNDISAKLNEGVLEININKPNKEELEKSRYINIY